jgi:hypothetical protein
MRLKKITLKSKRLAFLDPLKRRTFDEYHETKIRYEAII